METNTNTPSIDNAVNQIALKYQSEGLKMAGSKFAEIEEVIADLRSEIQELKKPKDVFTPYVRINANGGDSLASAKGWDEKSVSFDFSREKLKGLSSFIWSHDKQKNQAEVSGVNQDVFFTKERIQSIPGTIQLKVVAEYELPAGFTSNDAKSLNGTIENGILVLRDSSWLIVEGTQEPDTGTEPDPIPDPIPVPNDLEEIKVPKDGYALHKNGRGDTTFENKVVHADGFLPTLTEKASGIAFLSNGGTLRVNNCEFYHLTHALSAEVRNPGERIKAVYMDKCYIHDIFRLGSTQAGHVGRTTGVYSYNVIDFYITNSFIENCGWSPPIEYMGEKVEDTRDPYSHDVYIVELEETASNKSIGIRLHISNTVFNRAASHCINGHTVECQNVICANSPIHYGVQKTLNPEAWKDCWSVNVDKGPMSDYHAPRGWPWYSENPLNGLVKELDYDPIDWEAVRKAPRGDWWKVARSYIKQ